MPRRCWPPSTTRTRRLHLLRSEAQLTAGSVGQVETNRTVLFTSDDPLVLDSGARLGPVEVAYETYGELSSDASNAILVCHALTGDAHAAGHHGDPARVGWWDNLIGPGKPLDTDRWHVISANLLGGCQGTTGPSSLDPATGRPYGLRFPLFTVRRPGPSAPPAARVPRHRAARCGDRRLARGDAGAAVDDRPSRRAGRGHPGVRLVPPVRSEHRVLRRRAHVDHGRRALRRRRLLRHGRAPRCRARGRPDAGPPHVCLRAVTRGEVRPAGSRRRKRPRLRDRLRGARATSTTRRARSWSASTRTRTSI